MTPVMRVAKVRLPALVYDEYCRRAVRTGRTVQFIIYREIVTDRRGGRPRRAPSTLVEFRIPARILRTYKKRARREGKTISTLLRSLLTQRASGGDFVG